MATNSGQAAQSRSQAATRGAKSVWQRSETEDFADVSAPGFYTFAELPTETTKTGDFIEVFHKDYYAVLQITQESSVGAVFDNNVNQNVNTAWDTTVVHSAASAGATAALNGRIDDLETLLETDVDSGEPWAASTDYKAGEVFSHVVTQTTAVDVNGDAVPAGAGLFSYPVDTTAGATATLAEIAQWTPYAGGISLVRYKTVSDLIGSNETSRGLDAIWSAGPYNYCEAAPAVTDHHITSASGVKFYILKNDDGSVNLEQIGILGDGVADNYAEFQRLVDEFSFVKISSEFDVRISDTINTRQSTNLVGGGRTSNVIADNVAGPAFLTYGGVGDVTAPSQFIANFNISGTADTAFAASHCTISTIEDLTVVGFTGVTAFAFEYFWSATINRLRTPGATVQRPFVVNRVVLDSSFNQLYTSNFADYLLDIDGGRQEYSTGTGQGFGSPLVFNNFTGQGADKYVLRIQRADAIIFNGMYTENNLGILNVGDVVADIHFYGATFQGIRTASTHDIIVDGLNTTGIYLMECKFANIPHIFGQFNSNILINAPRVTNNVTFFPQVFRNANTPSSMGLAVTNVFEGNTHPTSYYKLRGFGWNFAKMEVVNDLGNGVWSSNPAFQMPLTTIAAY